MNKTLFILLIMLQLLACNNIARKEDQAPKGYHALVKEYQQNANLINEKLFLDYKIGMSSSEVEFITDSLFNVGLLETLDGVIYQFPLYTEKYGRQNALLSFDYIKEKLYQVSLTVLKGNNITQNELFNSVYLLYDQKYKNTNHAFFDKANARSGQPRKNIHTWIQGNIQIDLYTYYQEGFHGGTHISYSDWDLLQQNLKRKENETSDKLIKQIENI